MANRRDGKYTGLDGATALVTGAGSGIGKAIAHALANEGAKVAVTDINAEKAISCARELSAAGKTCVPYRLDVTSEEDWIGTIDAILSRWGKLDIAVNNAGMTHTGALHEIPLQEWRQIFAVNLDGVFLGIKHAIRAMRVTGGGSIINISSASGMKAAPNAAAYCTSKAGVRMLTKVAALECASRRDKIRVNTVSPGGVRTPMWNAEGSSLDETAWEKLRSGTPLGRFAAPEEIAELVLYLASPDSSFVTGADFAIDGGYSAL